MQYVASCIFGTIFLFEEDDLWELRDNSLHEAGGSALLLSADFNSLVRQSSKGTVKGCQTKLNQAIRSELKSAFFSEILLDNAHS